MTTRRCRGSSPPVDGAPLELEGIPPAAIAYYQDVCLRHLHVEIFSYA